MVLSIYPAYSDVLSKIFLSVRIFILWLIERIFFRKVVAVYFPSRAKLKIWKHFHIVHCINWPGVCNGRTFFIHNFSQSALGFTRKVIGHFERRVIYRFSFALPWFLILDSYSFAAVFLVLLFRQSWNVVYVVIRRIWRTVITVKANGEIRSLWIEASHGIPQTLCHKIAKCWAMIKSKW